MKVLEFHLNPKNKKDSIFKAFTFEPKKSEDQRKGNLYVAGELSHSTARNARLLEKISSLLKEEYYSLKASRGATSETLLKNAVKALNAFLEGEEKKGNIEWLGNLHLALWCCSATGGNSYYFHSTKSGGVTLLLSREKALVNLGKSIEQSHQTMNPVKVFGNIASGRVLPSDRIIVATRDLAEVLQKEKLFKDVAHFSTEKEFTGLWKAKEKLLSKVVGLLFFVLVEEPRYQQSAKKESPTVKKRPFPLVVLARSFLTKLSSFKFPMLTFSSYSFRLGDVITIGLFSVVMGVGLFFFRGERIRATREMNMALEKAQALESRAEVALGRKDEKNANLLLIEARNIVHPYTDSSSGAPEDFRSVQKRLEEKLLSLNKIEEIENPVVLFEIKTTETNLIPQRLLLAKGRLYAFNPFFSQMYSIDIELKTGKILQERRDLKRASVLAGSPIFFSDPNILLTLEDNGASKEVPLPLPSADFQADAMNAFQNSVYLLDARSGQIVQYAKALSGESFPVFWIDPNSAKNVKGAKAFAIDGNLWALYGSGEVQRYYKGLYQESVMPVVFPLIKEAAQIKTSASLPSLYVLDPSNNRVLVLSKFGDLVSQYTSPMFDNALDIAVSDDGKTLYVLNGFTIYGLELKL